MISIGFLLDFHWFPTNCHWLRLVCSSVCQCSKQSLYLFTQQGSLVLIMKLGHCCCIVKRQRYIVCMMHLKFCSVAHDIATPSAANASKHSQNPSKTFWKQHHCSGFHHIMMVVNFLETVGLRLLCSGNLHCTQHCTSANICHCLGNAYLADQLLQCRDS